MKHPNARWRFLTVLPLWFALGGCGTTVFLDKFDTAGVGQAPAAPATGTSELGDDAVIAANPLDASSADRWMRLPRKSSTDDGGRYTARFTQNLTKKKVSVDLVGFVPSSGPVMMTVFFEPRSPLPQIPLMHIDLLTDGRIRFNDNTFAGTFAFNHLVGFFITFDLAAPSPIASVLIRGGASDASLEVPIPVNAANFGLGQVRIVAPFEGVNAPNGSFLVNDVIATTPN